MLLTILENNQHISQLFNSINSDNFKEVLASTEENEEEVKDEESLEQKICNKLIESEKCEKMKEVKPLERKELTEEEIKAEAIINRYLEPVESEKKSSIDNSLSTETEIDSSNSLGGFSSSRNDSSTILSNEVESKDSTNLNQQINSGFLSTQEVNQSSANKKSPDVSSTNTQNLNNLNQLQLVDLIASTISNANNIDKNKVTQSLNDLIEPTKAKGINFIDSLKKIAEVILKDPSGNTANKIINIAKTK
jgi:hypothetical protein